MEKIILKDKTEIEIQDGASIGKITVLTTADKLGELFDSLNKENLENVQFSSGTYTNMTLTDPHFAINKTDEGLLVSFGLRELTEEEKNKDAVAVAVSFLSDEQALSVPSLFEEWNPKKKFKAGTRYRRNGILYKCLQDHVGQVDWAPEVSTSLFTKVLTSDDGTILDWVQPDSTNPYAKGDKANHNGKTWISDVDKNVWEPGVYGWSVAE